MAKTIEELKTQSDQIKNASVVGENTATRVGTLFNDIVEHVEQQNTAIETETARAKAAEEANAQSIDTLKGRTNKISIVATEDENDEIIIKDNSGNTVATIDKDGADFVGLKQGGTDIIAAIADETARAKGAEQAIIFDVSSHNDGAVFESLQALLSSSNLSTLIPTSVRHGGMTIRFIQGSVLNSDNKYVQYRLMADSFCTTASDWQGVDDEPTINSNNLVKSGGVAEAIRVLKKVELSDTSASEEVIEIKNESETETIVSISENGVDAKNLKSNGVDVVTHDDLNIENASSTLEEEQEQVWCNNSETEVFAKIGSFGMKAKSFQTLDGVPLGKNLYDIVVDTNGDGDYTTIEAALNNAGDTETKHVNILIKCGTYTPAPMVSHNSPYQTNYRNISLIGENRNKCIIKNTIGFYDYTIGTDCAPLRLGGNVTIENLTVICTSEDFDKYNGTPGYVGRDDYRKAAYCIHRDWYDRQGDAFVIKNCTLINDHIACIGFGLKENTKLVIENCYIQSEQAAEHSQENDYAPLWGHISSGQKGLGQDLIVIGSTIINKTGPYGFRFEWSVKDAAATPQDTHASLTFQGNILKSTDSENIINIPDGGYGFWEITDISFNNNVSKLNK